MELSNRFRTQIDKSSEQYTRNYEEFSKLLKIYRERLESTTSDGRDRDIKRHLKRRQLPARSRVQLLLDDDSPFLELFSFAGFGEKSTPRTTVIGIGLVSGMETMIMADKPTVRGGSINVASLKAGLRGVHMSIENRLPLILCVQSGGADLTQQFDVFHEGGHIFRLLAVRAQMGLPSIAVVFGSSTAGGAYQPGMSDYVVMVKDHAKVYLGGPPLVKMATGEISSHEELGGATMHSTVSGVSDYLAVNEINAVRIAREVLGGLSEIFLCNRQKYLPRTVGLEVEEPIYPADELLGIVSTTHRQSFDMAEVLARIVDGSRINFFKSSTGKSLVCAFAHLGGFPVGILGNNGVLFNDSSQKGAQFIQLCNQRNVPILFFHNITGFMVGKETEQAGLVKYGALLINAVSNSTVPLISIVMSASFGAGNYAMAGRAYGPRFMFSYPTAKCSVMGPEQLSGVLAIVTGAEEDSEGIKMYRQMVEKTMDAYFTSGKLLDDGIIDPRDTRIVVAMCLSVVYNNKVKGTNLVGVSRY